MRPDVGSENERPDSPARPATPQRETKLPPVEEVVLGHEEQAIRPPTEKQVHHRRPLPVVPEAGAKSCAEDPTKGIEKSCDTERGPQS